MTISAFPPHFRCHFRFPLKFERRFPFPLLIFETDVIWFQKRERSDHTYVLRVDLL